MRNSSASMLARRPLSIASALVAVASLLLFGCASQGSNYYKSYSGNPYNPDAYDRNPYDPGAGSYDMRSNGW